MAQNKAMSSRAAKYAGATLIGLLLSASLIQTSFADASPAPTPTTLDEYRAAMDQFKAARDTFNQALRQRDQQIRAINTTFKTAVDKATRDAKVALASAKTPEEKSAIVTARQSAIAAAIAARDSAIAALPDPGVPPMEPARPDFSQMQKLQQMQPMKGAPAKGKDGKGRN
mgnify:CR=1 FL=1